MDLLRKLASKFTLGDGCWEWTASKTPLGYGKVSIDYKTRYAHRIMYELHVGPIPEGLEIDHLCGNRGCVRPDHLEPVTHTENVRRGRVGEAQRAKTHCPKGHPLSGDNLGSEFQGPPMQGLPQRRIETLQAESRMNPTRVIHLVYIGVGVAGYAL